MIRGQQFNFLGGGGGGWVILKKNILQVHMGKKKFPAQDYCPNKIHACTVGWKKNSGKMFPGLTHSVNFISRLLKDFSIWTWVRGIHSTTRKAPGALDPAVVLPPLPGV